MQDRIRMLRAAAGWSQQDLAARIPLTQASLSNIETGASDPRPKTKERIARVLSIGPQALRDDVECSRAMLGILGVSPAAVAGVENSNPALAELRDILASLPPERQAMVPTLVRSVLGLVGGSKG